MANPYTHNVRGLFNKLAPTYDKMNDVISLGTHRRWRRLTTTMIPLFDSAKILDDCCGTGDWTTALASRLGPNGQVIGIDFSPAMLAIAHEKVQTVHSKANVKLQLANAMNLPFADNTFDFVTIGFGLRNLPDCRRALQEIKRVLKPGGTVICLETSQPTLPIIRQGWQFYFRVMVPLFGKLFVNEYQEYRYLQETTKHFMSYQQLASLFRQLNFENVHYRRYNFGAAAAHFGTKARNRS